MQVIQSLTNLLRNTRLHTKLLRVFSSKSSNTKFGITRDNGDTTVNSSILKIPLTNSKHSLNLSLIPYSPVFAVSREANYADHQSLV